MKRIQPTERQCAVKVLPYHFIPVNESRSDDEDYDDRREYDGDDYINWHRWTTEIRIKLFLKKQIA
jgi:hypothetical protein